MTYIASVVARKGVAVIADSLVTSIHRVIEENTLIDYLRTKNNNNNNITLTPAELASLFQKKPSHTKDFENKLYEYDKYTAITTSGMAMLDNMKIEEIIKEAIKKNTKIRGYSRQKIETKVKHLCEFLTDKVKEHLSIYDEVGSTIFILTHYDRKKDKTSIFRIYINLSNKRNLSDSNYQFVNCKEAEDYEKVVCDGQNMISRRILLGDLLTIHTLIPKVCSKIFKEFNISNVPQDYIEKLRLDPNIVPPNTIDGVKLFRLSDLSLQQAVDLACLLMNIEIDFQKYTEDIPTVGGVVKLAIIDEFGFRYIAGKEIIKPNNI